MSTQTTAAGSTPRSPAGYEKLAQARAPHDAVIQRQIGDRLTREERHFLEAILAKLLTDSDP